MPRCATPDCGSYAINHSAHGRDGSDGDLCDVCYWRKRAGEFAAPVAEVVAVGKLENESRELTPRIVPLTRDLQVGELLYRKPCEGADATR